MLNKVSEEIELLGHNAIIIKTDGENAIVAVQKELIKRRDKQTIPQNPPAYNPQSNGAVEKAVQDADAQLRCLKIGLEEKINTKIETGWPILLWMIEYAGILLSRYTVSRDGKTPHQRLYGKRCNQPVCAFGERVLAELAVRKSSRKCKLRDRWIDAVWVGVVPKTGER